MSASKKEKVLETQASDKILKAIGKDVKEEMDTLTADQLKTLVVQSLENVSEAEEQLAQNPVYQDLAARLNDVTQGLKDVKKFQGGKVAYARLRLREMGKISGYDKSLLEEQLDQDRKALLGRLAQASVKGQLKPRCGSCGSDLRETAEGGKECYRCVTLPRSQGVQI